MGWFNRKVKVEEKLNPVQPSVSAAEGIQSTREPTIAYQRQYENLPVVNRGVNMIVDDASDIPVTVGSILTNITPVAKGVRATTVHRLLNIEPNPFQDISSFRRNCLIDYIVDGNIFIYFDGAHLYHIPASKMVIVPDEKTYIKEFLFNNKTTFFPTEIIHIKDNSFYSIYRGISRLRAAKRAMDNLTSMTRFQDDFFSNGAVPGLVLYSPDTLSEKIKDRIIQAWKTKFRPGAGGRSPVLLDGGLKIDSIGETNFRELDFENSIKNTESTILKCLGIPPILLDGGNNANIRPNHRLFYLETILPIVRKINYAYSRFFGFEIWEDATNTPALQPELSDQASYYSTLVNGGILTPAEAREDLGRTKIEGLDQVRVPANIAGSAVDPSQGGRPTGVDNDK